MKKGVEIVTEFVWITSIEIRNKNAEKLVTAGRNRWKIENIRDSIARNDGREI